MQMHSEDDDYPEVPGEYIDLDSGEILSVTRDIDRVMKDRAA